MKASALELRLERYRRLEDATLGMLFKCAATRRFLGFTCEDEKRTVKVMGETRIPPGRYQIKLRTSSPMADRYANRLGPWHQGMLWLQDVPGFANIYIHIGNDEGDTDGCPLIGTTANDDLGTVGNSRIAYTALYAIVAPYLIGPDAPGAWVTVVDRDAPDPWR